jgi:hypothetical protein
MRLTDTQAAAFGCALDVQCAPGGRRPAAPRLAAPDKPVKVIPKVGRQIRRFVAQVVQLSDRPVQLFLKIFHSLAPARATGDLVKGRNGPVWDCNLCGAGVTRQRVAASPEAGTAR